MCSGQDSSWMDNAAAAHVLCGVEIDCEGKHALVGFVAPCNATGLRFAVGFS